MTPVALAAGGESLQASTPVRDCSTPTALPPGDDPPLGIRCRPPRQVITLQPLAALVGAGLHRILHSRLELFALVPELSPLPEPTPIF